MTSNLLAVLASVLGGAAGAALVAGLFALLNGRLARRDQVTDRECIQNKVLRYILLWVMQQRAEACIRANEITLEERRQLHHGHALYHDGLRGNGDADALIETVDRLPLKVGV